MAGAGLSELEREFYGLNDEVVVAEPEVVAEQAIPEPEAVIPEPEPTPVPEPKPDPVVETVIPEYKSNKKYIALENEKEIYETLDKKYRYDRMKPDEKALAFIAQQNPGLDENEIMFIAANEYGIGIDKPNEDDLTDAQVLELKKQDISRKKLMFQADEHFKTEAEKIAIDGIDPLDMDEDYKTYQTSRAEQSRIQAEQETLKQETIQKIEIAAKTISELKVPVEIDIDNKKFPVDVTFKMDADKQKQLVDYAKRYIPSDEEIAQFTDSETGKFDFKEYQKELANRLFYKDIVKAGLRQGLSQDREKFIETELKNSTLRNNDVSQDVEKPMDFVDAYWAKYGGK